MTNGTREYQGSRHIGQLGGHQAYGFCQQYERSLACRPQPVAETPEIRLRRQG
ncbi:hypothetical protein ACFV0H_01570 [Streptomyces erythrochromogenes]|uniref:hypothetical protein n=1 Tax=Streptomyces erythrochromogenes TaxID=285574 RepID=UPI0036A40493